MQGNQMKTLSFVVVLALAGFVQVQVKPIKLAEIQKANQLRDQSEVDAKADGNAVALRQLKLKNESERRALSGKLVEGQGTVMGVRPIRRGGILVIINANGMHIDATASDAADP